MIQGGCARHGGRQQNAVPCKKVEPSVSSSSLLVSSSSFKHHSTMTNEYCIMTIVPSLLSKGGIVMDWINWENLAGGKSQRDLERNLRGRGAVLRYSSSSASSVSKLLIIIDFIHTGRHDGEGETRNGGEIDAGVEPFPNEAKVIDRDTSGPSKCISKYIWK